MDEEVVRETVRILKDLGFRVYLIGARSLILYGVDLGRTTRDWDLVIDRPYTTSIRDLITHTLRSIGYTVQ